MSPNVHPIRAVLIAAALLLAAASLASASATLLLEEPYGHMGFFTGTGHAAVYLSNVCANNDDPRVLRPCAGGETGVVLSRYDGVAGYDWLAIPLIPYLYAVDRPADIPLFADAKMVAFLRDSYRRKHLENIVPDNADRTTPAATGISSSAPLTIAPSTDSKSTPPPSRMPPSSAISTRLPINRTSICSPATAPTSPKTSSISITRNRSIAA